MIANLLSATPARLGRLSKKLFSTAAMVAAATTLSHAQTVQTLSPENNGTPASAGSLSLQITYDVDVVVGSGTVMVLDLETFDEIASFDITDPDDATVSGNTVTFAAFDAIGGESYFVESPEGFVVAAAGGAPAPGFGFESEDVLWFFDVVAPDTTAPELVSTSPQNGPGVSVSSTLSAIYDENVSLGAGPWMITVFDVTGDQIVETFTEADTSSVEAVGTRLSFTLANDLAFNNEYRVTTTANVVMDSSGNFSSEIASGEWQFTTGEPFSSSQVVISQVFGGGGNSGAPLRNDYVELYNRSGAVISLEGWSVQYASSGGSFNSATVLSGSIQPGGYYLVQQAEGNNMSAPLLPTPDATGTIAMSGSNGKVALSNASEAFGVQDPLGDPALSDLVAYGSATPFEGSGATPGLSSTTAAFRKVNGSQDTNNNAADFDVAPPMPRNSSSPPFIPGNDGSGIATASNVSADAGILLDTEILRSATAARAIEIDLVGTLPDVVIEDVEIDVPADFGTLAEGNISISGAAAGSGSASLSGQTITISGVAVTPADSLIVTIGGLTTPDASTVPSDTGERTFTLRTGTAAGFPAELVDSPAVTIAVPVADLATLRSFDPNTKTFIITNEVIVTFFDTALSFRNQHYIQDSTAGILIDDAPFNLGTSYVRGDGITNLLGRLSVFEGLLQFNPISATQSISSQENVPVPVVATLEELTTNPLTFQSRLTRVNGVSFQDSSGSFADDSVHILTDATGSFSFRTFNDTDYVETALPTESFDLVGLVRRLDDDGGDAISSRELADFIGDNIFPDPGNGSGTAVASNASPTAGSLSGFTFFPSSATSQTLQIDIQGVADSIIETVQIDVPADFGALLGSNVSISGAGIGTGMASLTDRTITVSGVAVTDTDFLVVSIAGLTAPDVSDPSDDGNRTIAVRTAISGGTARAVSDIPQVRIAMPVADLATLRAVVLPSTKVYLVPNQVVVTYVEENAFRNQFYAQDSTGGILIDDAPLAVGTAFTAGDGITNLVGSLSIFRGILQFNPAAATTSVVTSGNITIPIERTLAELESDAFNLQSRLVKVSGVAFEDPTGNFANNSEHVLVQGSTSFVFRTFFDSDYADTPIPSESLDVTGIVRSVNDTNVLSPRALTDIVPAATGGEPTYSGFSAQFAGGQGPLLDFDNDGVRNGLEYLFGVNSAGFTPTPQITNGEIVWPIDPTRTDVGFIVETSSNLEVWEPVLEEDLDLTNPNSVRFVVPTGTGPFFVRIGATFAPEP